MHFHWKTRQPTPSCLVFAFFEIIPLSWRRNQSSWGGWRGLCKPALFIQLHRSRISFVSSTRLVGRSFISRESCDSQRRQDALSAVLQSLQPRCSITTPLHQLVLSHQNCTGIDCGFFCATVTGWNVVVPVFVKQVKWIHKDVGCFDYHLNDTEWLTLPTP